MNRRQRRPYTPEFKQQMVDLYQAGRSRTRLIQDYELPRWNYICIMIDLYHREIVGYSVGANKDANLVKQALLSIPYKHDAIELFHSDRGSEFDNQLIDSVLNTFGIERSLSRKGNPYDNAVAESSFKCMKTEFI